MDEPQIGDTVLFDGQPLRIDAFSEDHGTKLSDGRWVCASHFQYVSRSCWTYEDAPVDLVPAHPTISDVMDRSAVFQSAHALVTGLKWDESESPSVYDVLSVAKWLEGEA